jgi:general secretion pathway protein E
MSAVLSANAAASASPPAAHSAGLIGTLLVERGLVAPAELEKALAFQRQFGGRLGSVFMRIGALSEETLLPVLGEQLGLPILRFDDAPTNGAAITTMIRAAGLSTEWFIDQEIAIWEGEEGTLICAARNPISHYLQETIAVAFPQHRPAWHLARTQDLDNLLKLLQDDREFVGDDVAHLRELAEEAPVVELVNNISAQAIDERASDIHIEPEENSFVVRFRVDGVLQTRYTLPRDRFDAVASRIKLISGLDIAERRLPQDGRISIRASGTDMDIRVSVIPGVHGESIVLRLLPKKRADLTLEKLGMEPDHLAEFERWAKEPHGIVLVTGPTGSGKSTSLYAALAIANDRAHKIITVEDPVEYKMPGITQIQTHSEIGYDFARALRSILRHDPDIIMIGEIRDVETAEIAVQAALTGHMVFSTLHTNDALSAFNRLLDMGLEPFLVASSIRAVEAQRLTRKLCVQCSQSVGMPGAVAVAMEDLRRRFPELLAGDPDFRIAVGCHQCQGTGYRGRVGIYEFVNVTLELQEAILRRVSTAQLIELARSHGYRNLREDGLIKAWRGTTSVDEVLRVTGTVDVVE